MQTLTIQKSVIEQSISNMQSAINKKHAIDITSNIMFEVINNKLILKATDHEFYIKTTLTPNHIENAIKGAVNGESISNVMKSLEDGEIILEETKDSFYIKQNKSSFKLPLFEVNDFPFSQNYQNMEKVDIDNNILLQSIKKVLHCCSEKETINVAMQGILLEIKDNTLSIVATDSKRLGYIRTQYKGQTKSLSCIIPKKAINEILRLFNNDFEIFIKRTDNNQAETIGIINNEIEFYSKLINAKYPDYENLLKQKPNIQTIKVEKDKLLKAINQINSICYRLKITFRNNEITLETLEGLNGASASVSIDAEVNITEEKTTGLVNKHILECITSTKFNDLEILIDNPNRPIFIMTQDFEEIIMPQII